MTWLRLPPAVDRILRPAWAKAADTDLRRALEALGQQPTPDPDPDTIARLNQHLADCRARLNRLRSDLDQLEEDAR